jgi:cell division protein FtsB
MSAALKKALLIGCNYKKTAFELAGCINDAVQWHNILQDVYGFEEDDIVFLRDDKSDFRPTRERIISELTKLVAQAPAYLFIFYSGHGTATPDMNGDEADKMDECLVPCDVQSAGVIKDDELNNILKGCKSTGLAIFDCCRSGTVLDLPNVGILSSNMPVNGGLDNKLICISGCRDNEDAAEVYNLKNMLPQGALTITLLNALRKAKYYPKMSELLNNITADLTNGGLTQLPVISSNGLLYNDTVFPLEPLYVSYGRDEWVALNNNLADMTKKVADAEKNVTESTKKVMDLTRQNQNLSTQLMTIASQNATLNNQVKTLTSQVATFTAQNRSLTTQVATLTAQNRSLTTQVATLTAQNRSLTSQVAALNKVKK